MIPGIIGNVHKACSMALKMEARENGFHVCSMMSRGSNDLPLTSGKLHHNGLWEDFRTVLEYINKKYRQ